jgi:D-serine deaminase-like pyridoxal phosphate-dependent protein
MTPGTAGTKAGIGPPLAEVDTPALLIDVDVLEANIATMATLMAGSPLRYRPHTKTHKSPVIAQMQTAAGADGVCCAKLAEARILAAGGCDDILITSPVVGAHKAAGLVELATTARVAVVADDAGNAAELEAAAAAVGVTLRVLIEIDVGQGRCGVRDIEDVLRLAERVAASPSLDLAGVQGYQGAIQLDPSYAERRAGTELAHERLLRFTTRLRDAGLPVGVRTGGGTGTLAIDLTLPALSELQPGSYVFMDTVYGSLQWSQEPGSTPPFASALSVLATVISRPEAGTAIIDAGHKALSADGGTPQPLTESQCTFAFAGDEHARLDFDGPCPLALGDTVAVTPSHCDTTVNLHDIFTVVRAGTVEAIWQVAARGAIH